LLYKTKDVLLLTFVCYSKLRISEFIRLGGRRMSIKTIEKNNKTTNRFSSKVIAYMLLAIFTFGAAIYGITNTNQRGIIYQSKMYEEINDYTFKNKTDHHITTI
jgi:hypothetical protein